MRVLVTGARGFIGSHLVDRLLERGDNVAAVVRAVAPSLSPSWPAGTVTLFEADQQQGAGIRQALEAFSPDAIVHLAAQSLPSISWERPWKTLEVNIAGGLDLLEALRAVSFQGPVLMAGSSSEYASPANPLARLSEGDPAGASSPYAVSKIAVDQLARLYYQRYGLRVIRFRPFFWIGPRKTGDVCSDFARRIVQIETGKLDRLRVGNLDIIRDLLDVRDGVDALLQLIEKGRAGEAYNICSGVGTRLHDVVMHYRQRARCPVTVEPDPALLRPIDEMARIGNPAKIMALCWQPQRAVERTLEEILAYWRARAAAGENVASDV